MAAYRQRRGKGTWPLNPEELAESKKLAAPLERRKSSLKVIPEGSPAADADGAGSSKAEAPKKVSLSTEAAKSTEEVPPPHVEKNANEVDESHRPNDDPQNCNSNTEHPATQPFFPPRNPGFATDPRQKRSGQGGIFSRCRKPRWLMRNPVRFPRMLCTRDEFLVDRREIHPGKERGLNYGDVR